MMLNMNIIVTHISDIPIFFEMHMQKITKNIKICILTQKNIVAKNV